LHTQQFAIIRKFTTLYQRNTVYLQHGGRKCCRQHDVTVTLYTRRR